MGKEFKDLIAFVEDNNNKNKVKHKNNKLKIVIFNLAAILLLISGGVGIKVLFDHQKDEQNNLKNQQELQTFQPTKEENSNLENNSTFEQLIKINDDTKGWLKVNNTLIDLPIVQTDNNTFYLNHDFYKKSNSTGWVFADYRNDLTSSANLNDNTIIYGHTYQDKIMLSSLKNALDPDWYNEESNLIIELQLKEEKLKFEIFSIYTISETSDYLKTDMTDEEFQEFISVIKQRSIKNFNKEIKKDAKILTLSTCYIDEDHRLVVHAKLLIE